MELGYSTWEGWFSTFLQAIRRLDGNRCTAFVAVIWHRGGRTAACPRAEVQKLQTEVRDLLASVFLLWMDSPPKRGRRLALAYYRPDALGYSGSFRSHALPVISLHRKTHSGD